MANPVIRVLSILDSTPHEFIEPSKKIHESQDVSTFLTSKAYTDIMTWILQLNRSMFPVKVPSDTIQTWTLNSDAIQYSAPVRQLQRLLSKLEDIILEVPPDTGPRRFGNISFRRWSEVVESRASDLLRECLPADLLNRRLSDEGATAETELKSYLLGSWGSGQRLDYGTGHELSFLAFLGGIWKLNGFPNADPGVEERAIVIGVIHPYLELIRLLIKTYNLEPAGSHGVWGLDDHSFIPYLFGSAQLSPAIDDTDLTPEEGSLPNAPDPGGVANAKIVERERQTNLYFSAIGFIYDVKRGPFWEHSPMLFDISGIRAGWGKINKGMIKMYNAEVLSKFPVVQHFPFGSLFSWDRDPSAPLPPTTVHATSGPQARPVAPNSGHPSVAASRPMPGSGTHAPWAKPGVGTQAIPPMASTAAPWAGVRREGVPNPMPSKATRVPSALPDTSRMPPGPMAPTRAPSSTQPRPSPSQTGNTDVPTKAPWAK
ncbi:Phosphotyrosyl phosphatase activator, PTPA [Penicillium italicum]|uniref:Serine/threonine-protein phosphatase 2A activator n=1 Tax=Penicillium italicum TaxID=40296 RepID=A0A0A2L6F6_PENIT|nr:Phosphotyrosyl phosphatase activator, PTPA [Penicillium italicum]